MTIIPLPIRSNPGLFKNLGSPKLVNAYSQENGPDQKSDFKLVPCAGSKQFGSETGGACRGMAFVEEHDRLYSVNGIGLYEVEQDGTVTNRKLVSGTSPAFFARNDTVAVDALMVINQQTYVLKPGSVTFKNYHFNPDGVTFAGGYFVFWESEGANGGRFHASGLNSIEVDALSFATAEGDPDGLTKMHGSINTLYAIGKRTIEVWQISGGASFPFARVPGAHIRFGSESPHTIRDFDNGVVVVGNDNVVYHVIGYNYRPISSEEVSRLIEQEADKASIVGFTYERGENKFYCLQGTGWTREYNSRTDTWHDRRTGPFDQWEGYFHARAWNKDILGQRTSGKLQEIDTEIYTEDGKELVWGFDTANLNAYPNGLQFDNISFDMESGHGDNTTDPLMMFAISRDDNRTFTQDRHLSLGKRGEHTRRARTHRLGYVDENGISIRVRISDPVIRSIAQIDMPAKEVPL